MINVINRIQTVVSFGAEKREINNMENELNKVKGENSRNCLKFSLVLPSNHFSLYLIYGISFW